MTAQHRTTDAAVFMRQPSLPLVQVDGPAAAPTPPAGTPHPLRSPCKSCGRRGGLLERKSTQDVVTCAGCGRFAYNAPRAETVAPEAEEREPERVLCALPRKGKGGGREEFRIALSSYEGFPFVSLRVWYEVPGSGWRPSKTGITVRVRELDAVRDALTQASTELDGGSR